VGGDGWAGAAGERGAGVCGCGSGYVCLDAKLIEKAITPTTKAILPVHLGMRFADMDEILRVALKHNLKVVEDCAHAHGGMWKGKGAARGGHGCVQFQSSKLITSGEGGAVITNNLEYMELVQSLHQCGAGELTDKYKKRIIGVQLPDWENSGAVLGAQLERMPKQWAIREKNMSGLRRVCRKLAGLVY